MRVGEKVGRGLEGESSMGRDGGGEVGEGGEGGGGGWENMWRGGAHRDESLNRGGTRAITPLIFVRSF